jgi:arginine N-succinyltransferase
MREADLPGLLGLRELAGAGFTSLSAAPAALQERLAASEAAFLRAVPAPGPERYMLGLEHVASGRLVGVAAVKALVGVSAPFFNFRILRIAQACASLGRRFDLDVLIMVNEFAGASEVGSLFVHPAHRGGGVGRWLAQSRYLLLALEPQRFADTIVSELRGVVDAHGRSPFWEALGRHFFRMDFEEADRLSAGADPQFLLDLMPKYPIYVDLLPGEAADAIGREHSEGVGARRLLEQEGFRYDRVVDVFDAGPLLSASRDALRTVREARAYTYRPGVVERGQRALVARRSFGAFRCAVARVGVEGRVLAAPPELGRTLEVQEGEQLLAWVHPDAR